MKLNVYAIYDIAVGAYMRPMFMQSDGQAKRLFIDLCSAADSEIAKHPEDYSLVRIGIWDDNTARWTEEDKDTLVTGTEALTEARKVIKLPKENYGGTN